MKKNDRYCYTYDKLMERLNRGIPSNTVCLVRCVCRPEDHKWTLETEGPEVFVAVCSVCGKRTTNPGVLSRLLDDFSY